MKRVGASAMSLFENSNAFRKRVVAISAFYVVYFSLSVAALVRIAQADYTFALIVPIVTASLHFVFALVAMIMNDRTAMNSNVAKLVLVFDWAQAFALGIASSSISRDDLSDEVGWAVAANVIQILAQLLCGLKSYDLLNSTRFDQNDGEFIG